MDDLRPSRRAPLPTQRNAVTGSGSDKNDGRHSGFWGTHNQFRSESPSAQGATTASTATEAVATATTTAAAAAATAVAPAPSPSSPYSYYQHQSLPPLGSSAYASGAAAVAAASAVDTAAMDTESGRKSSLISATTTTTTATTPPLKTSAQAKRSPSEPAAMSPPRRGLGRVTRISKACDMCRARKVKCDAAQPCRSCRDLGVTCTTQYVSRRRGPVSKYVAQSAKQSEVGTGISGISGVCSNVSSCAPPSPAGSVDVPPIPAQLSSSSPPPPPPLPSLPPFSYSSLNSAPEAAASGLSTDAIAPLPVLALLIDDFFTYIHPLIPFPHEPTFRQRFASEAVRREPAFLALLAAMVGSLAASFPRSVRAQLKAAAARRRGGGSGNGEDKEGILRFPRAISMVECCRSVALAARGAQFYNRARPMTTDDAATSYLLGLAAGYTFEWSLFRRFTSEAMSFVQELGVLGGGGGGGGGGREEGGVGEGGVGGMGGMGGAAGLGAAAAPDAIQEQIGRRIYWILFLAARSMQQAGASPSELPLPLYLHQPRMRPPLPAEVDDAFITAAGVGVQPPGTVSLLTGYNRAVQIYATMDRVEAVEGVGGGFLGGGFSGSAIGSSSSSSSSTAAAADQAAAALTEALQAAKALGDVLPDELHLPLPGSRRAMPMGMPMTMSMSMTTTATTATTSGISTPPASSHWDDFYDDVPGYRYYPPAVDLTVDGGGGSSSSLDVYAVSTDPATASATASASATATATLSTTDDLRLLLDRQPRRRRQVQYDIQKTNIYASLLATRSYYVERYGHLVERMREGGVDASNADGTGATADAAAAAIAAERDLIVRSLLLVLATIPQCNMEPNGCALINKIRQVASTLLGGGGSSGGTGGTGEAAGEIEPEAAAQLGRFLEILVKLERLGHAGGGSVPTAPGYAAAAAAAAAAQAYGYGSSNVTASAAAADESGNAEANATNWANMLCPEDEEEELQSWANLREEQMHFAANGGFLLH